MSSIKDRIASLNLNQVGQAPRPLSTYSRPAQPSLPHRAQSSYGQNPPIGQTGLDIGNQPAISLEPPAPSRPERRSQPPPPPPRAPRESQNLVVSTAPRRPSATNPRSVAPALSPHALLPASRPPLPPRGSSSSSPSSAIARIPSSESVYSNFSTTTSLVSNPSTTRTSVASRSPSFDGKFPTASVQSVKAPPYDPSSLPPLPPRQSDRDKLTRPSFSSKNSSNNSIETISPSVPDRLNVPSRPVSRVLSSPSPGPQAVAPKPQRLWREQVQEQTPAPQVHERQPVIAVRSHEAPPAVPNANRRSALEWGLNKKTEAKPPVPSTRPGQPTPSQAPVSSGGPPPIPTGSRPDLAALQASKPRPAASRTATNNHVIKYKQDTPQNACLKCRDFSGPDNHAARFPREAIPSQDIAWLAHQLTDPFPSLTDKARALFVWQHHNISYNVADFFSGNVKRSTPASTIATGMAVCEGYAALFAAMALHAGLEAIVLTGHGAGVGYTAPKPGEPLPPPNPTGHAWNAVRLDSGEWKLIDVCWGAGHLNNQQYHRHFHPECFTMDNDEFGLKHFPRDVNHFFRSDGTIPTWEEYYVGPHGPGEKVTIFTGCVEDHGFSHTSFLPAKRHIATRGPGVNPKSRIQFQMSKYCPHWHPLRNGKGLPYQYVLAVGGKDGRERKNILFRTNGENWWVDVALEDLGCAGQKVNLYAVTTVGGETGRGMTLEQVRDAMGRKAMSFGGVAEWQLV